METNIEPKLMLSFVKDIEVTVGRVESFRNGPRAIDLDILTYDSMTLDTRDATERKPSHNLAGHLLIPLPRIAEREFVLRPLKESVFSLHTMYESHAQLCSPASCQIMSIPS